MLKATLRGIWSNRGRFFMTGLAVVLAVTFMSATLMLTGGIGAGASTAAASANRGVDLVVRASAVAARDAGPGQAVIGGRATLSPTVLAAAKKQPGVHAAGVQYSYAQLSRTGGHVIGQTEVQMNIGTNWIADPQLSPFRLKQGRAPSGPQEVVVDAATASHDHVKVGDRLQIVTLTQKAEVAVVGIATYGGADGITLQSTTLFSDAGSQRLLGGQTYDHVLIRGADRSAASVKSLASTLAAQGFTRLEVVTGPTFVGELQKDLNRQLQFIRIFLTAFALIALLVGGSLIYNTFGVAVSQRTRELALLRSLGATGRQVFASVVGEAAIIGLLSSGVGLLVGFVAEIALRKVLRFVGFPLLSGSISTTATSLGLPVLLGVVVTLAASLVPARRASRVEPVAALRENSTDVSALSGRRRLVGVSLVAAGAATIGVAGWQHAGPIIGLGVAASLVGVFTVGPSLVGATARLTRPILGRIGGRPASLATRNTGRDPRRSAATANALMLGVAVVVLFSVIAASINRSTAGTTAAGIKADTVVSSITTEVGLLRPKLLTDLRTIPGIEIVSAVHVSRATVDGNEAKIGSVDEINVSKVWDFGRLEGNAASLTGGHVLVQHLRAPKVKVGDHLAVVLPDGMKMTLTVGGLFTNNFPGFDAPAYLLPSALLAAHDTVRGAMWMLIKRTASADATTVNAQIGNVLNGEVSAKVQTAQAWAAAGNTQIRTIRNLVWTLDAMALVIALLGIANTITLAMHQRKRELGLLRSLGITRNELCFMVNIEAVLLAIQGSLVGVVVGSGGAWALTRAINMAESSQFAYPTTTVPIVAAAAVAAAALLSVPPSIRAGRVDPLSAIANG